MRFTPNTHESGRIFFKPLHHTFFNCINPLWIKIFSHVKFPWFFHFTHVEKPIIISNIVLNSITYRSKDFFKPVHWNICIKSERCTLRHCQICCWPPVSPVQSSDPETYAKPTSQPSNKLSRVHCIFQKNIWFRGDNLL